MSRTQSHSGSETLVAKRDQTFNKDERASSSLTVFVRIPSMQSRIILLKLAGCESLLQLHSKVQDVARVSNITSFTLKGHKCTSVSQLRQNDTLVANVGELRGGSQPYVTLTTPGDEDVDDVLIQEKNVTIGECIVRYYDLHGSTKKKQYNFQFSIRGEDLEAPDERDRESQDWIKFAAQDLSVFGHEAGDMITVVRTEVAGEAGDKNKQSAQETSDRRFLKNIPCFTQNAREKFIKELSAEQKTLMESFVERSMDEQGLNLILTTMTNDQIDNLLLVFQANKTYKMQILKYLLTKAGQWTDISETMNQNASEVTKTLQIRRLINSLKNTFDPKDENDSVITELLKIEQSTMLNQIISNMSDLQKTELLMQICNSEQRAKVIDCLRSQDVKEFWPLMTKERRMEIFAAFQPSQKMKFMVSDEYLTADLKIRLWDNIGKEMRLAMWQSISRPEVVAHCAVIMEIEESKSPMISRSSTRTNDDQFNLQRRLLAAITVPQRSRLWSNLPEKEKQKIITHVIGDDIMAVQFWNTLNHDKRCELVDQLSEEQVIKLFLMMKEDLENRTSLYMMLNQEYKIKCQNSLETDDEREELFVYGHFEEREKTAKTSKEYLDDLTKDYYDQNNQVVPFDKIEGGYIQCIANPQVKDGFITVQIVEPRFQVDNKVIHLNTDFENRELETDEARSFGANKNEHNDQFRFTQNLYGQLQETEPNPARNSSELGVISFFEYSSARGMQCTHSFFAQNPVKFKRNGKSAQELVLFTSQSGDVFFFNKKSTGATQKVDDKNFDLCLQILNEKQHAERGELSRETSESCFTYRIDPKSMLFDLLMKGRFVMRKYTDIFHLNSVPSMVVSQQEKFIVFSHCSSRTEPSRDQGPSLYFYDVNKCKEVLRVRGGEAFIDYHENITSEGVVQARLMMLGNKEIMGDSIWGQDKSVQKSYAEKYDACVDPERKAAIVLTILIDLHGHDEMHDVLSGDALIPDIPTNKSSDKDKKDKGVSNNEMGQWMPQCDRVEQIFVIDLKDEDKNFSQRYLRQTPTQIFAHSHDRDKDGKLLSFTVLFCDIYAYTFSYIQVEGVMSEEVRNKTQQKINNVTEEIKKMQAEGDKRGDLAVRVAEKEQEKKDLWTKATPKLFYFKCKYKMPEASCLIQDRRDADQMKSYVQVSNRNEKAQQKATDNLRDVNQFEVLLYNISDTRVKPDSIERIPNESEIRKVKVAISRDALQTYAKNLYANKFGDCWIKSIATPVLFHKSAFVGGFLYQMKQEKMQIPMLDWYVRNMQSRQNEQASIVQPLRQSVQVDYPIMVYKGFVPDNRELILVNLADKTSPQKIMHLYDMQFLCFVGHNFSDREVKIGMLCMEENEVRLCWLIYRQPYIKRQICDLDHLMIHKVPMQFNVPILDQIGDIQKVEFISSPGLTSIEDSLYGVLVIQTKNELYYSSNLSGKYDKITGGTMKPLTLQRGFNSVFYFVQAVGETDSIVQELKMNMMSGEWDYQLLEIHKVSEGKVIALEIDPENCHKTDSAYDYDNLLIEQIPDVLNIFYVIDDKENMWKIRQKGEEESGARYEVIKETNLSMGKDLTLELNEYKQKEFNRLAITDRCLTVNNKNFNFFNQHVWKLDIDKKSADDQEADRTDEAQISKVVEIQSMRWTSRQLIECVYQEFKDDRWKESHTFITKLQPGSRRQDLVGLRGLRDMESVNLISNNHYLMKFKGSDQSGIQDYWSVIDKYGQILDLPDKAKDLLIWSNFATGQSRQKSTGVTVILRGGQKRVISFDADVTYIEKKMTKIEFNRDGEVIGIKEFQKQIYEDKMRECIREDLMDKQIKVTGLKKAMTKEKAAQIADTLKYQDSVLCTKQGDLYRIASIVDKGFDDEVAVNPMDDEQGNQEVQVDELNMGIFIVQADSKEQQDNKKSIKLVKDEKELKIILFLCKSQRDRNQLHAAGFVICGKYLCWSYPEEKLVHTLDMQGLNEIKVEEATRGALKAMQTATAKLLGGEIDLLTSFKNNQNEGSARQSVKLPATQRSSSAKKQPSRNASTSSNKFKTAANARRATSRAGTLTKNKKPNLALNDSIETTESLLLNQTQDDDHFIRVQGSITMPDASSVQKSGQFIKSPKGQKMVSEMSSRIRWKQFTTKALDLRVMCESDSDKLSMILAEAPKTMQFSLSKEKTAEDIKGLSFKQGLRDNMLQVTIRDRTILYDLEPKSDKSKDKNQDQQQPLHEAQELILLNATSHFIPLDKYVEVGLKIVKCTENPQNEGYLVDQVITNRCKDVCLYRQDRLIIQEKEVDGVKKRQPRPPISKGIFKKFAEIDLQELNRIQDKVSRQARLDNIDFQTILSTFQGHTAFSIFATEVRFHEQVLTQIQEGDWLDEEQEDESILENNELRRLFRILTLPTPDILEKSEKDNPIIEHQMPNYRPPAELSQVDLDFDDDDNPKANNLQVSEVIEDQQEEKELSKEGLESVLQKSLYTKSSRIKDCLLSIANRCADCSISCFCATQDDFSRLLKNLTTQAIELIQDSFVSTPFTQLIVNVPWGPEVPMITFRRPNSLLTQNECELEIQKALVEQYGIDLKEQTKAQVEVRLLDLSWLLADRKNFINFVGTLEDAQNDQIFNTELINTLLDNFWEENFDKILKKCLLPWVGYAFCAMWFFVQSLHEDHNDFFTRVLGLTCLVGLVYQISIEYRQNAGTDSAMEYFTSVINLIDLFQVTTSLWIILMGILGIEFPSFETQRVIAAMATLCLWIKVLDWCKLFGPTSFFVRLISETIYDIRYFIIIFFVALMMFGMPLYILQLNRGEENNIVDETFGGLWFLNAFYNQYMLALGEFNIDNYGSGPQTYLCFILFLSATFLTQITFLNMLIALMGDTFAKVMEQKEQFGLQTKLAIMSDYTALVLDKTKTQDNECYMFVVTQKTEGTDDPNAAWEGNLSVIKKVIEKGLASLQKNMDRKLNAVHAQNMESKTRDLMNDKDSRGQYLRIMEKFAVVDNRFNQIDVEKTDKIYEIVRKSQQESRVGIRELADANESVQAEQARIQIHSKNEIAKLKEQQRQSTEEFTRELKSLQTYQRDQAITSNELKEVIERAGKLGGDQSDGASNEKADAMSAQILEAKQAIADAAQNSNEAIAKLSETIVENKEIQDSFFNAQNTITEELKSNQDRLAEELRDLKASQTQFQETLSQQLSGMTMSSIEGFMERISQQLSEQQQQMQQEILSKIQSSHGDPGE